MKNTTTRKETKADPSPANEKGNSPVTTLWVDNVAASIWGREVQVKGEPVTFYSVSLERSASPADFIDRFSGTEQSVADYLAEDVLAGADHRGDRFGSERLRHRDQGDGRGVAARLRARTRSSAAPASAATACSRCTLDRRSQSMRMPPPSFE